MDKPKILAASLRAIARFAWPGLVLIALSACENPVTKELKPDPAQQPKSNNYTPTVSAVSNFTIAQDSSATVNYTINDQDGPLSCQSNVYLSTSDASLLPVTYMTKSGSAPNCQLRLTPAPGFWGSVTVRIEVNDGHASAYSSFTMTVTEGVPTATVSSASANEGNNATFTVQLTQASPLSKSVTYATSNGTAIAGSDYTSTSGTLVFTPGQTSKTVTVPTIHDNIYAPNKSFTLTVTAVGVNSSGTGTVVNTDAAPTASAANVSANEGSSLTFTVDLNRASTTSTTVTYATANGTAISGTNYTSTSGTLTYLAGETSKTVTVASQNDGTYTSALNFSLGITANATTNTSTGTINNTDAAPTASASNVSANEGSALTFTVNLDRPSSSSTTVTYSTANGTAIAGTNYTSTSGTLTFLAGETSKTLNVPSQNDGTYTSNLSFTLSLTASGTTNTATGTVVNTDAAPTASAANASANEGTAITFTVNLNRPSSSSTSVTYSTTDGTAAAGTNYTSTSGTLTFLAGETSKTVSVPTADDSVYDSNLTFTLSMTANSTTNTATGTVINIDAAPTAAAADVSANEGSGLTFTVNLNRASTSSTTVTYATVGGTAFAGTNYTAASGTLTFTAGQTSKTITVTSLADGTYTPDLNFTVSLTANSVTNSATGTIVNTDAAPTASAGNISANEGSDLVFTVSLDRPSSATTSVTYSTSNGTAASGTNYTAASGTLTFTAGQTSKTVTVSSQNDGTYTPDLTFTLSMTANSTTNTATGTVVNTDAAPTASAANASASEGSAITFTVNLNRPSSTSTSVTYATSDSSAAAGTNYTAASGTLTFLAGETSKTVTVTTADDSIYTPNLTFTLSMTANATTNTATGTVINTNAAPTASAANVSANEGSDLTFTVNLTRASSTSTTVTYATVGNTAFAGTNYTATSGTLTFTAGQTSKTVTVSSLADSVYTPNLTFDLNL
ncbi:MAG: beta strand repeat-containing protein, partial [Bdellovibrionota bacterium]